MNSKARVQWHSELRKYLDSILQKNSGGKLRIGIIGALGCSDVGDEAMLLSMIEQYKEWFPQAELTIFSIRPEVTYQYVGIRAQPTLHRAFFNRSNPISLFMAGIDILEHLVFRALRKFIKLPETWCGGWALRIYFIFLGAYINWQAKRTVKGLRSFLCRSWREHIQQLRHIDVLTFLGGGYINSWHVKARTYPYLTSASIAKAFGKPVIGSGLNLGPFNRFDRWMAGKIFNKMDLIGVRDVNQSMSCLAKMNVSEEKIYFSSDDALSLHSSPLGDTRVEVLIADNQPYLAVQAHKWRLSAKGQIGLFQLFARAIDLLVVRYNLNVLMLPMNFGNRDGDRDCLDKIRHRCSHKNRISLIEMDLLPQQLKILFANAKLNLCTRHHSLVFSVSSGVPTVAISFDPYYSMKLLGVSQEFANICSILEYENCSPQDILSTAECHLKSEQGK